MLTYIARRIVYSVPVLVVASFLTFWGCGSRSTRWPSSGRRSRRRRSSRSNGTGSASTTRSSSSGGTGSRRRVRGNLGISERTNNAVLGELIHRLGTTIHLIVWSTLLSAALAIGIGVYSAVKQYSIGD